MQVAKTKVQEIPRVIIPTTGIVGKFIAVKQYRNPLAERGPFDQGEIVQVLDAYPDVMVQKPERYEHFFVEAKGLGANSNKEYQFFLDELDIDSISDTPPKETDMTTSTTTLAVSSQPLNGEIVQTLTDQYLARTDTESAIDELMHDEQRLPIAVAALLTRIYEDPAVYQAQGFETFVTYTNERFGFHRRKGYYMVQIFRDCRNAGISIAKMEEIGMTKLIYLTRAFKDNPGGLADAIDRALAGNYTVAQVQQLLAAPAQGITDGTVMSNPEALMNSKTYQFTLYGAQADAVHTTVSRIQSHLKDQDLPSALADAFAHIVTTFEQGMEGVERTLDFDCEILSARYGVRIGVLPEETETTQETVAQTA